MNAAELARALSPQCLRCQLLGECGDEKQYKEQREDGECANHKEKVDSE